MRCYSTTASACWWWGATAVNAVFSTGAPGARRGRGREWHGGLTGSGGGAGGGGGVQVAQGEGWARRHGSRSECLTCRRGEETVAR